MERVAALEGDLPILVIAPHGPTDYNTSFIAEQIAKEMDTYAVINYGWRRAATPDYWKDAADCNNIQHCHEDVVKEEFLDPILKFQSRCVKSYGFCHTFIIHGVGNYVRNKTVDGRLDIIVGYGAGRPPSYSCHPKLKDAFIYLANKQGIEAYEAGPGSQFSGRAKTNLNQLCRYWYPNHRVQSMQIEIVREFRESKDICKIVAAELASIMDDLLEFDDSTSVAINARRI